jgi:hypothetical protein
MGCRICCDDSAEGENMSRSNGRRGDLNLLLWVGFIVLTLVPLVLGVWPIVRDCGRMPLGKGEVFNRVFGLMETCP